MNMDLSFNSRMEAYYQTFFDLQEKLRKSEEERLKLEMKFNELVQVSREEEQAHYKKLRSQYKKFLEEDRKRQERNEKIVRTLERIESRVNMLSSKTERIKMLRRQYQNYLQRVSRMPIEKHEYFPPKIVEELPRNEPKSSCDITMLKKAFGKTNDEKIEILDKYLQSLRSQKVPVASESKLEETKTDFNEMKYLDEVSQKLNDGFNSNEANSIAEDIMNSIYARHYKTESLKSETKKVSKFTTPSYTDEYIDNDKNSGFGDSRNNFDTRANFSTAPRSEMKNEYPNVDYTFTSMDKGNLNDRPYALSKDISEELQTPVDKEKKNGFYKASENIIKSKMNFTPNDKKSKAFSRTEMEEDYKYSPSKTELDINETEKLLFQNPIKANVNFSNISMKDDSRVLPTDKYVSKLIKSDIRQSLNEYSCKKLPETVEAQRNKSEISSNKDKTAIKEIIGAPEQSEGYDITPEGEKESQYKDNLTINEYFKEEGTASFKNTIDTGRTDKECVYEAENKNNLPVDNKVVEPGLQPIQHENIPDTQNVYTKPDNTIEYKNNEEIVNVTQNEQPIHYDEYSTKAIYDEQDSQPSHVQYENNDQVYQESVQSNEQVDQYDPSEQPIEQLYGEHGKALQQYDENGQPVFLDEQEYNENNQPEHHIYDQHGNETQYNTDPQGIQYDETSPQYDESDQPIHEYNKNIRPVQEYNHPEQSNQQYDENSQSIQQYDEVQPMEEYEVNSQPNQNYDENGQHIQLYEENGQPTQLYDENGQPLQQYDDNGQPTQLYDENGQLRQQYDENGQLLQQYNENGQGLHQYDENGQPIYFSQSEGLVQYDENGQIIQQFDENGQPLQSVYNEPYQHYDENDQPVGEYDQLFEENGHILQQYEANQYNEGDQPFEPSVGLSEQPQNIVSDGKKDQDIEIENIKPDDAENINQSPKKKNVLDLLDTDTESIKQNTSKISNDSDFDFSNG